MAALLLKAAAAALRTVTQISGGKHADLKCLTLTRAAPITHARRARCRGSERASARRCYICFCFIMEAISESIPAQ